MGVAVQVGQWEEIVEERRAQAERLLERATADSRRASEVLVGGPAEELAGAAGSADLLVIGSRRWGALARVVVGSTAETLLRQAPCSLVLVPRPAEEPSAERRTERPAVAVEEGA